MIRQGGAVPTWPSAIDELEDLMFLNSGYKSRRFGSHVTPCSFSEFGAGRQTAAEWLRFAFHDMATTNVFLEPFGGIDSSIAFELDSGENLGPGFNSTLQTYAAFYNSRLSMSDIIALGVYTSVRACGGPVVPIRGGRIDATAPGPLGVPQPQNGQGTFINQFARMGFDTTDMIQMTACGHALGGVHSAFFPGIVAPGTAPDDYAIFDGILKSYNNIATRYITGPNTDPLSVGISVKNTRNSDTLVFTADRNVTITKMTNAATFNSVCSSILQRMIDTVAPSIMLSGPISPYEVKPSGVQLTLLPGSGKITFAGDIRVRTTTRNASQILSVQVVYKDRNGVAGSTVPTAVSGTAYGFDDTFTFYGFSTNIPATTSISSFRVIVTRTRGATTTYDNNGVGFLVQDSVIALAPQSCLSGTNLTIMAAIRTSVTSAVLLSISRKIARTGGVPVPALKNTTVKMIRCQTIGPYAIYSGNSTIGAAADTKYGVSSGIYADDFKDPTSLGAACAPIGTVAPSRTLSSIVSTSKSSSSSRFFSTLFTSSKGSLSSSASATPTPVHKPVVGKYSFQGCYTEATSVRALSGASYIDYGNMTPVLCAANCAAFVYWGIEYGGECMFSPVIVAAVLEETLLLSSVSTVGVKPQKLFIIIAGFVSKLGHDKYELDL
ncbi:putative fungistatic metabolite [Diplocarpon rosae]|nr:putative fungistatic metabolite [Diplocarpon rosae]